MDAFGTVHYPGPHYERNVRTNASPREVIIKLYWAQLGPYRRLVAVSRAGLLYFVHTDHVGGSAILSDVSGNEAGALRYHPYGQTRVQTGTVPTDRRFTGQTLDASTGLYFYGARYYDAALGRFVQPDTVIPDPKNPQSLNRYTYVLNNPLRYTDPSGNWPEDEDPEAQAAADGDAASQYPAGDAGYLAPPDEGDPDGPEAPADGLMARLRFWEEASRAAIAYEFRGPEMWPSGPEMRSYDGGAASPALSISEREAIHAHVCGIEQPGPRLSDWVQASGEAAGTVSNVFNIPNLDTEVTFAGSALLLGAGGSKFVPVVAPVVLGVQVVAFAWSGAAPWLADRLRARGM